MKFISRERPCIVTRADIMKGNLPVAQLVLAVALLRIRPRAATFVKTDFRYTKASF
jgi:hypothetical protein